MSDNGRSEMISITSAAKILDHSPHTVKKWIEAGLIPSKVYPNGRTKVNRSDVVSFFDSLPSRAILANRAD